MDRRKLLQLGMLTAAGSMMPGIVKPDDLLSKTQTIYSGEKTTIRLNANENVYAPSTVAKKAIQNAMVNANRYPLVEALPLLKKAIANHHQVDESMVLITAGSLQALKVIGTRLSHGKGNHVAPDLSFTVLMRQAALSGCKWKRVTVNSNKEINLSAMKRAIDSDTQFVYVTNPNNPTGHFIESNILAKFCKEVGSTHPLVVDEAYIEFVKGDETPSMVPLLKEIPNLIITRTFSKIHGLAGLRVGYALAKPEWVKDWETWDQNSGIGVTNISAMAALASLKDPSFIKSSKAKIDATRTRFISSLKQMGIKTYPSWTNFVLVEMGDMTQRLKPILDRNQIDIVHGRDAGSMKGLARISIGTDQEMDLLLKLIKSARS